MVYQNNEYIKYSKKIIKIKKNNMKQFFKEKIEKPSKKLEELLDENENYQILWKDNKVRFIDLDYYIDVDFRVINNIAKQIEIK